VGDAALTIDPEDPGAMAAALTRLAGDPGERARWRAAGLVNARRFDWGRNAEQTLALYERAAEQHPRRT
jgi:glycosyltransferase involved in cell wall biosynthesis